MMWGRTDANMRAADAFHGASWRADDFDACGCCGSVFWDADGAEDEDDRDPHNIQSRTNFSLCCYCEETVEDDE